MRSNTKLTFSKYNKGSTCPPEGCALPLEQRGSSYYFPSNAESVYVVIDGSLRTDYDDSTVQVHSNPYSNVWSSYIEPWIYDKGLSAYIRSNNDVVLKVSVTNSIFSQLTFSAAKITNEEITKTTNKRSFVYIYGEDFSYMKDGNLIDSNNKFTGTVFGYMAGNTSVHSITANSNPVTVIFIEEN